MSRAHRLAPLRTGITAATRLAASNNSIRAPVNSSAVKTGAATIVKREACKTKWYSAAISNLGQMDAKSLHVGSMTLFIGGRSGMKENKKARMT